VSGVKPHLRVSSVAIMVAGLLGASSFVQPAPPTGNGVYIPPFGPGEPYPSQIDISGLSSSIKDVNVTLNGLSHSYPDDIDVVLVGPGSQSTVLMSDAGGSFEVSSVNLTLDDEAAGTLPDEAQITSGTFRPTDFDTIGWDSDDMPPPAPTPMIASLSVFDGTNPNGAWSLFINDDTDDHEGILDGWSLEILTSGPPVAVSNAKVKEGKAAKFTLTRSLNLEQSLTASYATANGSAKAGRDFKKVSGTVTFAPGETTKKVRVKTKDDRLDERTEKFSLKVSSGGVTTKGTAKIKDND
jgi:subtilisin-like proprotein convertase family protein